jgi:hypothetical protein
MWLAMCTAHQRIAPERILNCTVKDMKEQTLQHHWSYHIYKSYHTSRPIRRTLIFLLEILQQKKCILILVIYWNKTGLLRTKISHHN